MRKGEQTKLRIIEKSAVLFNEKGYTGTTMQDIIEATGLTKGAVYRSFASKDEIAIEAFQYAGQVLWQHFSAAVEHHNTATGKILAMCDVYRDTVHNPPIQGGCPFLNTAVESDHSFPVLKDHALGAYTNMLGYIESLLVQGVNNGEFQADMNTESVASFIFSSIEGGIMASRLTQDNRHVAYAMQHIERLLSTYKAQ
ncbi:TetR family transcriptional regulator [Gordoniibacillus kamchatkensis]|uniref:TetR family transcriptional regulator n=1 Tax=Gordoniibacillus kamchatkensis TaxID=1590651 RepID=A0ABR5AEK0_9BACL|nr:TetR/AcrR family transcriptional regulator [Paenibacillus sp. VKM B-2647]KIL39025.1 TetR family transcriptional regulator [Paenibacillus sp. VKM B-2647]